MKMCMKIWCLCVLTTADNKYLAWETLKKKEAVSVIVTEPRNTFPLLPVIKFFTVVWINEHCELERIY